ncbi:4'-phosphopantetheinyl transferase superfamily protein [Eikenella sp. S3360]|uniref:4'-phosphopantetheinyl transferase superfamily protein n=1 Tax=Eikenella glucosivorans TaxID=2766967 RepID=A0ABS0N7F0_9NEIS|nr:4'-phosphopantetheinyl transferase superfamily protein [Eikenella glucosivorans]MBH5328233.1 4'-phosphopantetheinyl transferase superfamily protein [Eikenella glucosivorans]
MPTRPSAEHRIRLYLAAPDSAAHYCAERLDAADRAHLLRHPGRAKQSGWRVSRFLKQQAAADGFAGSRDFSGSLSHSGGHALLALPSADFAVGADLERLRPRDFGGWPDWVLHADEAAWLQGHADLASRYALWALKEALLKAAGQTLADLPRVGLRPGGGRENWRLCAIGRVWRGAAWLLDGEWVCAAVWPQEIEAGLEWRGFGRWAGVGRRLLYEFV